MYRCPKCGSTNLDITVLTDARLLQDEYDEDYFETDLTEAKCGDQEWDENSHMQCRKCGHGGKTREFDEKRTAKAFELLTTRDERELLIAAVHAIIGDLRNFPDRGDNDLDNWADVRIEQYRDLCTKLGLDSDA